MVWEGLRNATSRRHCAAGVMPRCLDVERDLGQRVQRLEVVLITWGGAPVEVVRLQPALAVAQFEFDEVNNRQPVRESDGAEVRGGARGRGDGIGYGCIGRCHQGYTRSSWPSAPSTVRACC